MTPIMVRAAMGDLKAAKLSTPRFHRMGDGMAVEILKIMGTRKALSRDEQLAVLALLHQAFERPGSVIQPSLEKPQATLFLLNYVESTAQGQDVAQAVPDVRAFVNAAAATKPSPNKASGVAGQAH
jgi:hypothetical protein